MARSKTPGRRAKKRSPEAQLRALTVGRQLVKARQRLGLSQTHVARECGWNATRLWKYETGHDIPSAKSLLALSRVLELPLEALVALANSDASDDAPSAHDSGEHPAVNPAAEAPPAAGSAS